MRESKKQTHIHFYYFKFCVTNYCTYLFLCIWILCVCVWLSVLIPLCAVDTACDHILNKTSVSLRATTHYIVCFGSCLIKQKAQFTQRGLQTLSTSYSSSSFLQVVRYSKLYSFVSISFESLRQLCSLTEQKNKDNNVYTYSY